MPASGGAAAPAASAAAAPAAGNSLFYLLLLIYYFYPHVTMVLTMACVCVSVTCQYCVKMAEQIQLVFGTEASAAYPALC